MATRGSGLIDYLELCCQLTSNYQAVNSDNCIGHYAEMFLSGSLRDNTVALLHMCNYHIASVLRFSLGVVAIIILWDDD